jgi:hypothetical protein
VNLEWRYKPRQSKACRPIREFASEILELLEEYKKRGIVEESKEVICNSPFFLLKKGEKTRPILDLREVNCALKYHHFKMEGIGAAKALISQGSWFTKIDLKDAYLSIRVADQDRRYLGFKSPEGKQFRFTCLPFGLASAPRIFTKIIREVLKPIRTQGITVVAYLDDFLIISSSAEQALKDYQAVSLHLTNHGFTLNSKKCIPIPQQEVVFLGMSLNSQTMSVKIPRDKVRSMKAEIRRVLNNKFVQIRKLAALLGKMGAMAEGFGPSFISQRTLQRVVIEGSKKGWDSWVEIPMNSKEELQWWLDHLDLHNGRSLLQPEACLVVTTDASKLGWGGHTADSQLKGYWKEEDSSQSSNFRELKAIWITLSSLPSLPPRGSKILIRSDNKTAVAQINRQSNPRHPHLLELSKAIWGWALHQNFLLQAEYIPGVENVLADRLSRNRGQAQADWSISTSVLKRIEKTFKSKILIDLFAAKGNEQTANYCSRYGVDGENHPDAFMIGRWPHEAYAHPPNAMIPQVLRKVKDEGATIILVTPFWESQVWFPLALQLSTRNPIIFEAKKKEEGKPNRLIAWRISGNKTEVRVFRKKLQNFWEKRSDHRLSKAMVQHGDRLVVGAVNGNKILCNIVQLTRLIT